MSISPMDLHVGTDMVLGWDWILNSNLAQFYRQGHMQIASGLDQVKINLVPSANSTNVAATSAASRLIGQGEIRQLLRQVVPYDLPPTAQDPGGATQLVARTSSSGWSKPLTADHTALAAMEAENRQQRRIGRRLGGPDPTCPTPFLDGVELLRYGTELHLALLRYGTELHLA
jgi:hypothetical protein